MEQDIKRLEVELEDAARELALAGSIADLDKRRTLLLEAAEAYASAKFAAVESEIAPQDEEKCLHGITYWDCDKLCWNCSHQCMDHDLPENACKRCKCMAWREK